jgi:DNA ligase (NAD+)
LKKIANLEGFKQKSIDNLKNAIENSKTQQLHRLIFGLGIRYVGEATAKTLAKSVHSIFDLEKFSLEDLQQLKDVGTKVGESIFSFFHNEDNIKMLETLKELGINTNGDVQEIKEGKLSGLTFLFTGTMPSLKRSEAEKMAEDQGGKLLSSVSKNLNYLVVGESAGSKLEKAKKIKSIQIIDEEQFLNMIQI